MKLFLLIVLVLGLSMPAQASSWLVCDVEAEVIGVNEQFFGIQVLSSVVTDGHSEKGSPCLEEKSLYIIEKDQHTLQRQDKITLNYSYYDSMTPNGPMSDTEWTVKAPSDGLDSN